jgi:hypothetical protein
MSKSRWPLAALICSLVAMPTISRAQIPDTTKQQAENFVHDVLGALLKPNWNGFVHGGLTRDDRFVLQRAANTIDGQRALRSSTGFNIGGGAGIDILLRMGLRASYIYQSSDLKFKTDDGTGSGLLDIDDVGTLKAHTATLEVMRYMLPARAAITPYGTLGIQGTWWVLDEKSALVSSSGASTPFSGSPLFSFGVQFAAGEKLSGRLEATLSSGHNPFTGNNAFRALSGPTIDEPTGVSRTDYRVALVYHFGKRQTLRGAAAVARK